MYPRQEDGTGSFVGAAMPRHSWFQLSCAPVPRTNPVVPLFSWLHEKPSEAIGSWPALFCPNFCGAILTPFSFAGPLQPFLAACSNQSFFQHCSALLHSSGLDTADMEKLLAVLQHLSAIR